jgi:hypothetical protein
MLLALAAAGSAMAQVEVLVSGGPAGAKGDPALVNEPFSVDFTQDGTGYGVEFTKANRIFKILAPGKVEFIAGEFHAAKGKGEDNTPFDGKEPQKARFNALHDLAITSQDEAYLAETYAHRIRKMNLKTGEVSTVAGDGTPGFAGDGGPLSGAKFSNAYCTFLSPDEKTLYVADIGNQRVRALDLVKQTIRTVAGNGKKGAPVDGAKATDSPLNGPRACSVAKDGTLYILQREGNSLLAVKHNVLTVVVNAAGQSGYEGDGGPGRDAKLNGPKYLAMDPQDNVIICDTENHCIRRFDPKSGKITLVAGVPKEKGGGVGADLLSTHLQRPHGARFDRQGRICIVDSENNRILRAPYLH